MDYVYDTYESSIGKIWVVLDDVGVRKLALSESDWESAQHELGTIMHDPDRCQEAITQLTEYFNGVRQTFDLPLSIQGTTFRQKVWDALRSIPYGQVCSYLDIAQQIGQPQAVRAVGQANRSNPLPIVIPCHRVIGKSGKLVGYAGDRTDVKEQLLNLEGAR